MTIRAWLFASLLVFAVSAQAQTPAEVIDSVAQFHKRALAEQQQIDAIYQQRQELVAQAKTIEQQASAYAVQNLQLADNIAQLRNSLDRINTDLGAVTETRAGMATLLQRMLSTLERFIALDLPFELNSRFDTIRQLRAGLARSDLDISQKYQAIISAYLREIRYGYNNAVSREQIELPTGRRLVQVLRLGRAGLWFVSMDGHIAGRWDRANRRWIAEQTDPDNVLTGIAIVQDQAAPAVVPLPIDILLQ